ncbi:hypothetical protein Q0F98_29010 [Paenibacillus amylolyticus]|nr:hypothetical protein Q0F98_29010 [Paenibacillus amylolyticus]
MGNFILKTDVPNKVLNIELEGSFSQEDGLRSISAYQDTIAPLNTKEYDLNIDCKKLNVTAPEIVPLLEGCLQMFKKMNIKSRVDPREQRDSKNAIVPTWSVCWPGQSRNHIYRYHLINQADKL